MPKTKKNIVKNNKKTQKIKYNNPFLLHNKEFNSIKKNFIESNKLSKDILKLEELSTQLLLKIDQEEIYGNCILRNERKTLINRINNYIDSITN